MPKWCSGPCRFLPRRAPAWELRSKHCHHPVSLAFFNERSYPPWSVDQRSLNSNQGWAKSPVGRKTLQHNYRSPHNHNDVKCCGEKLCFLEHSIEGPISDWCVCWEREEGWENLSLHRLHFSLEEHTGIGQVKLVVGKVRYTGLTLLHSLYEKGFVTSNIASWLSLVWADWRERDGNGRHHIIAIGHCTDTSFF